MENKVVEVPANVVGAMVQIIDLGGKAGAYQGVDITTVGQVREQLVALIQPLIDEAQAEESAE